MADDHAAATLATLRATIRRLALPASFALQPTPDWDALTAEQDAWQAAHPEPVHSDPCSDPHHQAAAGKPNRTSPRFARYLFVAEWPAQPTAATAMPARALRPLQAAHGFRAHIRW